MNLGSYKQGEDRGALLASRDFLNQVVVARIQSASHGPACLFMECYFFQRQPSLISYDENPFFY